MSSIQVTNAAFDRLQAINHVKDAPKKLRVAVLGGGCSGFQYQFTLEDESNDDDLVLEREGQQVLVDSVSLPFLEGSVIDYSSELIGARFTVNNPNASSTCGCGTSFSF